MAHAGLDCPIRFFIIISVPKRISFFILTYRAKSLCTIVMDKLKTKRTVQQFTTTAYVFGFFYFFLDWTIIMFGLTEVFVPGTAKVVPERVSLTVFQY